MREVVCFQNLHNKLLNKPVHFCSDRICEVKTMAEQRHLMMISWSGEIKLSISPNIAISPSSPHIHIQIDQFQYIQIHTWLQGLGE